MAIKQIDLTWISKEMKPGVWYDIKNEEQLRQFKQIIDKRFGYPVFDLSLSDDYKRVRKTEL